VTDSASFTTPEADEEDGGEALAALDDPLASLRNEEEPAPLKRRRGRAKKEAPAKDFKAVLWASANKLRAQMDAAEYKHLVLGLIFLKFISDTFTKHQPVPRQAPWPTGQLYCRRTDPRWDYGRPPAGNANTAWPMWWR